MEGEGAAQAGDALQGHGAAVGPGDLVHHGQAQTGAPLFAAGGISLEKPLPHLVLQLGGDADAVVLDPQQQLVPGAGQAHPHMALRLAVFEAVVNEVLEQAGEQGPVAPEGEAGLNIPDQALGGIGLLPAHLVRQGGQVHQLPVGGVCPLVQPGDGQQLADEVGHLVRLAVDHGQGLPLFLRGVAVLFRVFAGAFDDGHRGAQLVGGVGGELLFCLEGPLQPGKHLVEGAGQPGELIVARRHVHPPGQVGGLVDGGGGGGDLIQGAEGPPGDEPAAQGGQKDEGGQHNEGDGHEVGEHLGIFRGLQDAPHPHPVFPAQKQVKVQHIVPGAAGVHRPGEAVLEGLVGGEAHGHLPGQQGLVLAVHQGVYAVVRKGEALLQLKGARLGHGHVGEVAAHGALQLIHGGLGGHRPAHQVEKPHEQGGHEHHEQGVPDGDPYLHIQPLHCPASFSAGSRMTQPTPFTVWMSRGSRPSSIFLRRRLM